MEELLQIIQRVAERSTQRIHTSELGVVTAVFPMPTRAITIIINARCNYAIIVCPMAARLNYAKCQLPRPTLV